MSEKHLNMLPILPYLFISKLKTKDFWFLIFLHREEDNEETEGTEETED